MKAFPKFHVSLAPLVGPSHKWHGFGVIVVPFWLQLRHRLRTPDRLWLRPRLRLPVLCDGIWCISKTNINARIAYCSLKCSVSFLNTQILSFPRRRSRIQFCSSRGSELSTQYISDVKRPEPRMFTIVSWSALVIAFKTTKEKSNFLQILYFHP